jgi:outer membrane protein OmpA-like peptidoglycan-associated protein
LGTSGYNLTLGEQRSNAAKRYLADNFGISLYRMFIISYGEEKPTSRLHEGKTNAADRRVTLKVWGRL